MSWFGRSCLLIGYLLLVTTITVFLSNDTIDKASAQGSINPDGQTWHDLLTDPATVRNPYEINVSDPSVTNSDHPDFLSYQILDACTVVNSPSYSKTKPTECAALIPNARARAYLRSSSDTPPLADKEGLFFHVDFCGDGFPRSTCLNVGDSAGRSETVRAVGYSNILQWTVADVDGDCDSGVSDCGDNPSVPSDGWGSLDVYCWTEPVANNKFNHYFVAKYSPGSSWSATGLRFQEGNGAYTNYAINRQGLSVRPFTDDRGTTWAFQHQYLLSNENQNSIVGSGTGGVSIVPYTNSGPLKIRSGGNDVNYKENYNRCELRLRPPQLSPPPLGVVCETEDGNQFLTVTWSEVRNADSYTVNVQPVNLARMSTGTSFRFAVGDREDLKPNTVYGFKVKATSTDPSIDDSDYSDVVSEKCEKDKDQLPEPRGTIECADDNSSATFTRSTDDTNVADYDVEVVGNGNTRRATITTRTVRMSGLEADVEYVFRIQANPQDVTRYDASDWFELTFVCETVELPAPTLVVKCAANNKQIRLDWTTVAHPKVTVTYHAQTLDNSLNYRGPNNFTATPQSMTTPDTVYSFRVKAISSDTNKVSDSVWSKTASASCTSIPQLIQPQLSLECVNDNKQIELSWGRIPNSAQYHARQVGGSLSYRGSNLLTYTPESATSQDVEYSFQVRALSGDTTNYQHSLWSNIESITCATIECDPNDGDCGTPTPTVTATPTSTPSPTPTTNPTPPPSGSDTSPSYHRGQGTECFVWLHTLFPEPEGGDQVGRIRWKWDGHSPTKFQVVATERNTRVKETYPVPPLFGDPAARRIMTYPTHGEWVAFMVEALGIELECGINQPIRSMPGWIGYTSPCYAALGRVDVNTQPYTNTLSHQGGPNNPVRYERWVRYWYDEWTRTRTRTRTQVWVPPVTSTTSGGMVYWMENGVQMSRYEPPTTIIIQPGYWKWPPWPAWPAWGPWAKTETKKEALPSKTGEMKEDPPTPVPDTPPHPNAGPNMIVDTIDTQTMNNKRYLPSEAPRAYPEFVKRDYSIVWAYEGAPQNDNRRVFLLHLSGGKSGVFTIVGQPGDNLYTFTITQDLNVYLNKIEYKNVTIRCGARTGNDYDSAGEFIDLGPLGTTIVG